MRIPFIKTILPVSLTLLIIVTASCGSKTGQKTDNIEEKSETQATTIKPVVIGDETRLLLDDLSTNGDYVNSREFPSLIKASLVYEGLNDNNLVIDIRPENSFREGHIKGSVNVLFGDLPDYFTSSIKPFEYERIIIISQDGQLASYTTSLLRLMGYGNVYSMRWGMSSWNSSYAELGWIAGSSSKFEENLEDKVISKPSAERMPELRTGKSTGEEIGSERFKSLFSEGFTNVMITAEEVFTNLDNLYVINYDRRDKYEDGHIPGAVRYKPGGTLSFVDEMATIPFDKTVVVYCGTGHNSGFVTAYLRLFGYDARTLSYGNNGFMYNKMVRDRNTLSWLPFTTDDVNNYEVVK